MAINKVNYGDRTLIDLTDSTLTSSDELVEGVTAYDRSGNRLTGTADFMDKVDNPTADKILIDDGNGQAEDSLISIGDVMTKLQADLTARGEIITNDGAGGIASSGTQLSDLATQSDLGGKQDVLTAGTGIDISNNVITNEFETLLSPDLDDIKYNFSGYVRTVTNNPSGTNTNGYLQVIARKGNTSYTMQIYTPYNSNNTYTRLNNTTWGAWQPLTMTAGTGISISDNGTIINRFTNLTNVDLNTIRYNCQAYAADSCTNKPTTYGGMFICTMGSNNGTYGAQLFITYATTNQGVYYRRFNGSATPTEWVKLITTDGGSVETLTTTGAMIAQSLQVKSGSNQTSPPYFLCLNNSFSAGGNVGYVTKANMLKAIDATYEAGDTVTIANNANNDIILAGVLSASQKQIWFTLPVDKLVNASSVTINSLYAIVRGTSGLITGSSLIDLCNTTGYSVTARAPSGYGITVIVTLTNASSQANNTAVVVQVRGRSYTFS